VAARPRRGHAEVEAAIDRLVHYAGWTDKLAAVFGGANPVSDPSSPTRARADRGGRDPGARGSPLLGLVSVIAPVITSGNACVVIAAEADPCVAVPFAEVVATSDLPVG
jgi:aldehyde dehydrogenase (NAD+)